MCGSKHSQKGKQEKRCWVGPYVQGRLYIFEVALLYLSDYQPQDVVLQCQLFKFVQITFLVTLSIVSCLKPICNLKSFLRSGPCRVVQGWCG